MIAATFTQAGIGLIVAIPSLVLAWFGYRHSMKVDAIAEQAGIATRDSVSVGQVIDGLNKLVSNLQEDNAVLRERVKDLNIRLDQIIRECQDLKRQLNMLGQQINHDPQPGVA